METVKIHTKKGRIITLSIIKRTDTHLLGNDKFDMPVIIPIDEIDSMFPLTPR
jgi:sporulation protein YlmC with PRC-barrel domain